MQFLLFSIYLVHVLVSLFLILVVLLQQGKGADLAVFGGGSTQAAFGARSATTLLHKLTVGGFIIFIATTMSIAIIQTRGLEETSVVGATAAAANAADDAVDEAADTATENTAGDTMAADSAGEETTPPTGDAAPTENTADGGSEPAAEDSGNSP